MDNLFRPPEPAPTAADEAETPAGAGIDEAAGFEFPSTGDAIRVYRTATDARGPWFVASDVAKALGYRDAPQLVRRLDEDEKGTRILHTPGGDQRIRVISVSGLYSAILSARVPQAQAFKRWVTHDVLPAVLRRGVYDVSDPAAQTEDLAKLRAAFTALQSENADLETDYADLEAEADQLGERCATLGPKAVATIGAEALYGGQSVWDLRASLAGALEVGPREVMGRLVDLGVMVRHSPNSYRIRSAWTDLLFCGKTSRTRGEFTVHSVSEIGTPRVWPGLQDDFLQRVADRQAERNRRHRDRNAA
ncbi:Bro-N domain-containing protein [Glycomyces sp. NPDC047010]|uniref:BRO-N domain-containing protein n=1 Tax=Glycomyces sp. NPDC047010 TaxID=3155023 RepID=UPI0033D07383